MVRTMSRQPFTHLVTFVSFLTWVVSCRQSARDGHSGGGGLLASAVQLRDAQPASASALGGLPSRLPGPPVGHLRPRQEAQVLSHARHLSHPLPCTGRPSPCLPSPVITGPQSVPHKCLCPHTPRSRRVLVLSHSFSQLGLAEQKSMVEQLLDDLPVKGTGMGGC